MPWSKVAILGMVIQPLIGNPYNGYINPYYWVDDHPLLYGNNGSLDPRKYRDLPPFLLNFCFPRGCGNWSNIVGKREVLIVDGVFGA